MPTEPPSSITSATYGTISLDTVYPDDPPLAAYKFQVESSLHGPVDMAIDITLSEAANVEARFLKQEATLTKLLDDDQTVLRQSEKGIKELFDEYEIEITDFEDLVSMLPLTSLSILFIDGASTYYELYYECPEELYNGNLILLVDRNFVCVEIRLEEFDEE
jgi:hypothetical protein